MTALYPRPQTKMFPFESPVSTSPVKEKARQVTYLGLSLWSKRPVFLLRVREVESSCQKLAWPFPMATITPASSGWNSAATTVSVEHLVSVTCKTKTLFFKKEKKMWEMTARRFFRLTFVPLSPRDQSHTDMVWSEPSSTATSKFPPSLKKKK